MGAKRGTTVADRMRANAHRPDECWEWPGAIGSHGYGETTYHKTRWLAHRLAYVFAEGDIPAGYEIDHLCRNRRCFNPAHLEAVPPRVNLMRSDSPSAVNARKTVCRRGHQLDKANTYVTPSGYRNCRKCRAMAECIGRKRRAARAA